MFNRMDKTKLSLIAVAVAALLFVSVNIIANNWFAPVRADFTEGRSYTTSKQITPIFTNISEPIIVRLYFSQALAEISPRHGVFYQRVRDLLQQYAKLAKGNIKLELYNPAPFSDVEDRAVGFGLQAIPLSQSGDTGYFGLAATNSTDDQQVIPFFSLDREQFLEYDLTKLIYNLARPAQPKIGLITALALEGKMPSPQEMQMTGGAPIPPWAIAAQIKEFFQVQTLGADIPLIPADIDMLLLVQPENLSLQTMKAIDQYVLGGGKILLFLDPNAESASAIASLGGMGSTGRDDKHALDGIKRLMAAWGVKLVEDKVIGDVDNALRVNMATNGRPVLSDYVAWMRLQSSNFDPNDAVTGDLKEIRIGTPGALEVVDGAGTTVTPLITTGPRSMRIDTAKFIGMPDIIAMFRDFKPQNKREIIAARISGPAKSAFDDLPANALKESKQPIQMIVVADTDMLVDRFWVEMNNQMGQQILIPTADNGSFVSNALENLSGAPALSSLRGRGVQARPFTMLDDIRRDAEMQYRAKEQSLTGHLDELEKKAQAMQVKRDSSGAEVLSEADKKTVDSYRGEILATRRELRDVQRALRENIERLQSLITFTNIGGVPIIFGLILIAIAVVRHRRRRRRASDV